MEGVGGGHGRDPRQIQLAYWVDYGGRNGIEVYVECYLLASDGKSLVGIVSGMVQYECSGVFISIPDVEKTIDICSDKFNGQ